MSLTHREDTHTGSLETLPKGRLVSAGPLRAPSPESAPRIPEGNLGEPGSLMTPLPEGFQTGMPLVLGLRTRVQDPYVYVVVGGTLANGTAVVSELVLTYCHQAAHVSYGQHCGYWGSTEDGHGILIFTVVPLGAFLDSADSSSPRRLPVAPRSKPPITPHTWWMFGRAERGGSSH